MSLARGISRERRRKPAPVRSLARGRARVAGEILLRICVRSSPPLAVSRLHGTCAPSELVLAKRLQTLERVHAHVGDEIHVLTQRLVVWDSWCILKLDYRQEMSIHSSPIVACFGV
jgi:hypothetical protein